MQEEYAEFNGTPEEAESFLNVNVDLAKSWILKHVPRKTLEAWVAEKRLTVRGGEGPSIHIRENEDGKVGGNIFEQVHMYMRVFFSSIAFITRRR